MNPIIQKTWIFLSMLWISIAASAYDFEVDGIYYTVVSLPELTCEVSKSPKDNEYSGDIKIPAEVSFRGKTLKVERIGSDAFRSCESLTSVDIPNSVTVIGDQAFDECTSLASVKIPNSVTEIGDLAFDRCKSLRSIVIPSSLKTLSWGLFRGCSSLKEIIIPENIIDIKHRVFAGSGIERCIIEDSKNSIGMYGAHWGPTWGQSPSDCIFPSNLKYLYLGRDYYLWGNRDSERRSPFLDCICLEEVVIGSNVTKLSQRLFATTSKDYKSFSELPNFTKLTVLESSNDLKLNSESTQYYGFGNVKIAILERNINTVEEGENIGFEDVEDAQLIKSCTTVNERLFNGCTKLKTVTLGENVTTILDGAFNKTDELMKIVLKSENPPICYGSPAFSNKQYINAEIYVPDQSLQLYKEADVWKDFWNIKGMSSGVDMIVSEEHSPSIILENGNIRIINKNEKSIVQVFSSQGVMVAETSDYVISNLNKGFYIVTVETKTFKISLL